MSPEGVTAKGARRFTVTRGMARLTAAADRGHMKRPILLVGCPTRTCCAVAVGSTNTKMGLFVAEYLSRPV